MQRLKVQHLASIISLKVSIQINFDILFTKGVADLSLVFLITRCLFPLSSQVIPADEDLQQMLQLYERNSDKILATSIL